MTVNEIIDDYAYILVKIAAAKDRLIKPEKFLDLISSKDIDDFKTKLSTIDKDLPADVISNSKNLEASWKDIFFSYINSMIVNSPRSCQVFLITLLQKYEIENLKTVIVGKVANINEAAIKERLDFKIEKILHTDKLINDALHVVKVEDILYLYKNTQYYPVLREILNRYNATKEVFFIYAFLDRYYIRNLNRLLTDDFHWTRQQRDVLRFYIGTLTDFYNLSIVLRSMNCNFTWSEVELILTFARGISNFTLGDLKKIYDSQSGPLNIIKDLVKNYPKGAALEYIIDPRRTINSLDQFYFNLQIHYLKSKKFSNGYEFAEIISFLIRKEAEIDNLVAIFEGIKIDYNRESLKSYLITEVAMK